MLEIKTFTFSSFGTNCYVVSLPQAILLVDPACSNEYEQQQLLRYINSLPLMGEELCSIERPVDGRRTSQGLGFYILATHGHLDHLWGAAWATKQWNTPVFMHAADIPYAQAMQRQYDLFGIPAIPQPFPVENLDSIRHQPDLAGLEIIETPGHTPGSVCFYWPSQKVLLAGDTLFCRGYGRTDLPGGDIHQLIASLRRLNSLPSDTLVYPGHGETTTIGDEKW